LCETYVVSLKDENRDKNKKVLHAQFKSHLTHKESNVYSPQQVNAHEHEDLHSDLHIGYTSSINRYARTA